jgi:Na+/proline symporter
MATGSSIFLIALGAILTFAVDASISGLDLQTVGVILMVAGVLGLLVSLLWLDRATAPRTERRVVEVDQRHTHERI